MRLALSFSSFLLLLSSPLFFSSVFVVGLFLEGQCFKGRFIFYFLWWRFFVLRAAPAHFLKESSELEERPGLRWPFWKAAFGGCRQLLTHCRQQLILY
jgi:hypothetical protein